jgi:predicted phosphodiesterase
MKLNVISDLHLNVEGMPQPRSSADVVVLAGDIGRPAEAVAWAIGLGKPAVYVPGNHEFYGGSINGTLRDLRERCKGSNVHVLDKGELTIAGVRFLGATLWTDFKLFADDATNEGAKIRAQQLLRDFSRIRLREDAETMFCPDDSAQLHRAEAAWLDGKLAERHDGATVVVTHHAPSKNSIHRRFEGSVVNACFVSDCDWLLGDGRADLWIHGHTHDSFDYRVNGTRVICNPRGYAKGGVSENPQFDPELIVEI